MVTKMAVGYREQIISVCVRGGCSCFDKSSVSVPEDQVVQVSYL